MSDDPVSYLPSINPEAIQRALTAGDLSKLSPEDRIHYYLALCHSSGLNPLTRPFIVLRAESGEMVWYATRECAEQLRKLHRVSMRVLSRERTDDGLYIVTVEASTPEGRVEQAQGIVPLAKAKGSWKTTQQGKRYFEEAKTPDGEILLQPLYGKERADAMHRAESKAKRRATLALCGLGLPDAEPDAGQAVRFDPQTGVVQELGAPADGEPLDEPVVSATQAAQNVGELFDRSEGKPEPVNEPA